MSTQRFLISKFDESIVAAFLPEISAPIGGQFVLETPDGVQVAEPLIDYSDLKAKKYAGIAAMYPDFPGVLFDEFDSDATIDLADPSHRASTGSYAMCLSGLSGGLSGTFRINARALGFAPANVVVFWQVYEQTFTQNAFGGYDLEYVVVDQADIVVQVSVDNGSTFDPVLHAAATALSHTGTQFIIRFRNDDPQARYVGYYSFHYRA